jgi:hypothetical protein
MAPVYFSINSLHSYNPSIHVVTCQWQVAMLGSFSRAQTRPPAAAFTPPRLPPAATTTRRSHSLRVGALHSQTLIRQKRGSSVQSLKQNNNKNVFIAGPAACDRAMASFCSRSTAAVAGPFVTEAGDDVCALAMRICRGAGKGQLRSVDKEDEPPLRVLEFGMLGETVCSRGATPPMPHMIQRGDNW